MKSIKSRSNMWYLLPICVGLIGGVIAYFILRHDDLKKAKYCLVIGIISVVIGVLINVFILTEIPILTPNFSVNV